METVSGILAVGEAQGAMRAIGARQRGPLYIYYGIMIGLIVVGAGAGIIVDSLWHPTDNDMGLAIGIVVGLVLYAIFSKRIVRALFRRRLAGRGISLDLPLKLELGPEEILYEVGGVRTVAQWSCVTEMISAGDYWVILAQASPLFAPKRFFADKTAEQRFVQAVIVQMSEAARARSPQAVSFARDAPATD